MPSLSSTLRSLAPTFAVGLACIGFGLPNTALATDVELDLDLNSGFLGARFQWAIVSGLHAGETVTIVRGDAALGDGDCPDFTDACLDVTDADVIGFATADFFGFATQFILLDEPGGEEVTYQAVADRGANSVVSNPVRVRAPNHLARIRAVHASPDAPPVDIYANGALLLEDVPFAAASGFLEVPPGDYTIDIRAAGADRLSAPVYSADLHLSEDVAYTAVATGFLGSTDAADAFRVTPLIEDWGDLDRDAVRVRVVHASPDAPTVAVDVGNDGTLDIPALDRFADTGAEGVALPANTPLAVGIATTAGDPVTAFSVPPLPAGGEVTVIAIGELAGHPSYDNGFSALALFRDGSSARIRQDPVVYTLHASPGAPAVDVLAGGAPLITDLSYRELSGAIQVPPGSYDLDVAVSANGAIVDTFSTPELIAGERYLATATGFVGSSDAPFQLILTHDGFVDDGEARVAIVHASPDAPAVDIGGVSTVFTRRLFNIPFTAQTRPRGVRIDPGVYNLGFAIAGDPAPLFVFPNVGIAPGSRAIFLATGSVAAGDFGATVVNTQTSPWSVATVFPQ